MSPPERVMVLHLPEIDPCSLSEHTHKSPDPDNDIAHSERTREWAGVIRAVEQVMPGVEPLRLGCCALRARGPARYYGDETAAATALLACASELGFAHARVGVANGRFAAEQAALDPHEPLSVHVPSPGVRLVFTADTTRFLAPLPVSRASGDEQSDVLVSLGIRTLGALAALPETAVRERFGPAGIAAQRRAQGLGAAHTSEVTPLEPTAELSVILPFEPPLDTAEQLAFACSAPAAQFVQQLVSLGQVCTELRVEFTDDIGVRHERVWAHPSHFTASDIVNRVRWQASSLPQQSERGGAGIAETALTPVRTARAAEHEPGLWNSAPDERIHHHLSRVQSVLGHTGVVTGELAGGRTSNDRQRFIPWGTTAQVSRATRTTRRDGPWPGHLAGAPPNEVFAIPIPATLFDPTGTPILLDALDLNSPFEPHPRESAHTASEALSGTPARLAVDGHQLHSAVRAWSAPWPLRERWWHRVTPSGASAMSYRLQVLLDDGDAWLLRYQPDQKWTAEARYL